MALLALAQLSEWGRWLDPKDGGIRLSVALLGLAHLSEWRWWLDPKDGGGLLEKNGLSLSSGRFSHLR